MFGKKFPRGLNDFGTSRVGLPAPIAWKIGLNVCVASLLLFEHFPVDHLLPSLTLPSVRSSSIRE
ncbi:hypothetical protein J2Y58_001412 [Sphingomonas sp. BE138]|uniref:hypothetical protein n=1 Tax=Sphingomonas sp. BE138 TaxID=2817845 RepID=UPI00285C9044|nr:hypothetical protein [Sphingomonas sp. BE138]MDR6788054.1 hypothetical protein [Sphingomonas sp. BE138]